MLQTAPPAFLLIDWQKGFRDHAHWGGTRNNPQAEQNAAMLLQHWRTRNWPVIHLRHASRLPDSPLAPGNPGHAFEDFAEPLPGEPVYVKDVNAAFIGTTLEADLRAAGFDTLVISGLTTDHCVSTTTRMAANLGFNVVLIEDACATFARTLPDGTTIPAETMHTVNLASLRDEFATVMTTANLLRDYES